MKGQELFYPDISVQVGAYHFTKGISVMTCSDDTAPLDWGRVVFTKEYQPAVILSAGAEVVVKMGYNGMLENVFIGNLVHGYNQAAGQNEILFKDRMLLLQNTLITETFLNATPQDIILTGLKKAGITEYKICNTVYPAKSLVPVIQKSMVSVLKYINSLWQINVNGAFIKGVFYWGVTPEQEEIYQFEYGNNIISLTRASNNWILETVSMPFLQHSQKIAVVHPKISGVFRVRKVIFRTNDAGFTRTTIFFRGGPLAW